ncbi:MAG: cupin domain-containing protein [Pseudomonadota bacterium]
MALKQEISSQKTSSGDLSKRLVRYEDLIPCLDAFIDTRTPGSDKKENFTIIGPGVSENPNQHIHIAEPHGFNIGGARQPPGCTNSQHSHETEEVFFVHSGDWAFRLGEHATDAEIILKPGDLISIPTHVFRGFENVGSDIGYLWAVLGGDDPGRVLWAPKVFDMAQDYGLVLLENGNLVDTTAGESVPDNMTPMPRTTSEQIAALQVFDDDALAACCVCGGDQGLLIGPEGRLNWKHGFTVERLRQKSDDKSVAETQSVPDVLFLHEGALDVTVDGETVSMRPGDTLTIPIGTERLFSTPSQADYLRVLGQ